MVKNRKLKDTEQGREIEDAPEVYAVQKDLTGWRFKRREFLAAGAAAAAAATVTVACGSSSTAGPTLSAEEKVQACLGGVKAHADPVLALAVTPDGSLLLSGGEDGTVRLWSLPGGALVKSVEGPDRCFEAFGPFPDDLPDAAV